MRKLEEIFKIAAEYATGKIVHVMDEDGKERLLTVPEKQFWARIAAYSAQIINNISKGFDERQIDQDLENLARMLNEGKAKDKVTGAGETEGRTGSK